MYVYGGCSPLGKHTSRVAWENPSRGGVLSESARRASIRSWRKDEPVALALQIPSPEYNVRTELCVKINGRFYNNQQLLRSQNHSGRVLEVSICLNSGKDFDFEGSVQPIARFMKSPRAGAGG